MSRIARVQAVPLAATWADLYNGIANVPASLLRPASHFAGTAPPRTGQFSVLVTVTDGDGRTGVGEAWGLPLPDLAARVANDFLGPQIINRNAGDIAAIWHDLFASFARLGHTRGVFMEALSGIDIALWDLAGKQENKGVAALIGGGDAERRARIEVYASPILFTREPNESARLARAFVDQGFRAVKVKAGRGVETDAAHLAAVREAVGASVALMVDVNGAYDVVTSIALAHQIAPLGITWIEEPVPPEHVAEMAAISRAIVIPLAAGENDFSLRTFEGLLERRAVTVVQPNVARAGGITGVLAIADAAKRRGASVSLHGVGSGIVQAASLQLMSALPASCARFFEANRFPNPLRDALTQPPLVLADGFLTVPTGPGLGVSVDEATVERYRTDRF